MCKIWINEMFDGAQAASQFLLELSLSLAWIWNDIIILLLLCLQTWIFLRDNKWFQNIDLHIKVYLVIEMLHSFMINANQSFLSLMTKIKEFLTITGQISYIFRFAFIRYFSVLLLLVKTPFIYINFILNALF